MVTLLVVFIDYFKPHHFTAIQYRWAGLFHGCLKKRSDNCPRNKAFYSSKGFAIASSSVQLGDTPVWGRMKLFM